MSSCISEMSPEDDEEKYRAASHIAGLVINAIDPYIKVKDSALYQAPPL